ncbi:uncharacterized protein [Leptinotarsa decemlineata]|uniref:uncharacterized protein n=1 Tax=Leptinotarsa decemlineata TaxID=7539 RepID=UPI003D30A4E2
MPQKYSKRSERRSWTEVSLIAALEAVDGGESCNSAASSYDIPEATLRRYIKKHREGAALPEHGGRCRNTFSSDQSQFLANYITDIDRRAFGLTKVQLGRLAFDFAEQNNISHRFNKSSKMAGKDWIKSFQMKFKVSLRTPEPTSIGRLMGFNKIAVEKFFHILREVRDKYNFEASRIYNADESGLSSVPTKLPKILSPTGARRVARIVTAERGKNTTVVCAANALGHYVPPFSIFGRIRMKDELLFGAPPGSRGSAHKNGWMCTDIFLKYLKHFKTHTNPTPENPVLLLVDNHSSHISLQGINYCRENGIVIMGFPPHTTHQLQPLDVYFFWPLKTYFSRDSDSFVVSNTGQTITDKNICRIFNNSYLKATTVGNAVICFRKCGIESFDPFIFGDEEYAATKTTEKENYLQENNLTSVSDEKKIGKSDKQLVNH